MEKKGDCRRNPPECPHRIQSVHEKTPAVRAYIDSDVLVWHLRGEAKALRFFRKLRADDEYELWTGAVQRAEIVFFMRPEEEEPTLLFLSQLKTAPIDQNAVDAASKLYRKWHPSHGIDVNDALLAATAMMHGGIIFTLNLRHFPMPDLRVKKAW
jgi:predicted nucleic acid-binding protein